MQVLGQSDIRSLRDVLRCGSLQWLWVMVRSLCDLENKGVFESRFLARVSRILAREDSSLMVTG